MSHFGNFIRVAAVATLALGGVATMAAPSFAKTVMVGGAAMYPNKNIVENAVNSKDHTTLVAAVKAAGLVDTLSGPGPFTVFAPTNEAFAKLPAGTVDTLLKPANKDKLTAVLTYHVVPGKISAADIMKAAKKMNGMAEYKTVQGESLKFKVDGKKIWVMDAKGDKARVTIADVNQSNGVIHVINAVLLP
ncbi:fasciclin domain-containing protein [Kaistia defluvii]|uniref:fasciclin domain-containing protein n=1 Tax=Kaistia defluvii TaxID=410841 RepID=UPI003898D927